MSEIFLIAVVIFLFSISIMGIFLPFLPGVFLSWLAVLLFAFDSGFSLIPLSTVAALFFLFLLTMVVDFFAPIIGAKKHKASTAGLLGTALGFMFGFITMGFPGIFIGPIAGAFLGEIINGRSHSESLSVAMGSFVGFLVGSLFKMVAIFIMIGVFVTALL